MTSDLRDFEWDADKSLANLEKHGIDFETAKVLWDDPHALTGPGKKNLEERFMTVGRLGNKLWSAIHTYRDGRIRIISVRRSRHGEIAAYETAIYHRTKL
ncbi:MAG: BrnT family toxin [Pseudomonadota bacterium]